MSRADRDLIQRKLRQARIQYESSIEMRLAADELMIVAQRLVDEVADLEAGRPPVPRLLPPPIGQAVPS